MKASPILLCFLLLCVSTACATKYDWEAQPAVIAPVPTVGLDVLGPDPSAENILRGTRGKSRVDTIIALEDAILKTQQGGLLTTKDEGERQDFIEDITGKIGQIVAPGSNIDSPLGSVARFLFPNLTKTTVCPS